MVMQPDLEVEEVPVSALVPYVGNAKKHPEWQVEEIASSIEAFGFNDPIAVWEDIAGHLVIVEGHGRLLAAKRLGLEEVPVIHLDHLDDEGRRAYMLAHNQLTMNTGFDAQVLEAELDAIEGLDMSEFGFDTSDVEIPDSEDGAGDVFAVEMDEAYNYIVLSFERASDWEEAQQAFGLEVVTANRANPNVRSVGIGRVVDGARVLGMLR